MLNLHEILSRLERESSVLEPTPASRGKAMATVSDYADNFLEALDSRKAYENGTGDGLLAHVPGENGLPLDQLIELFDREVVGPGASVASGTYLAYIPGSGLYHAALGDFLAAVTNKYSGVYFAGPGPVRMEQQMVRWTAELVGYPEDAGGHIASGGSMANLAAIMAARDAHELRSADYASAVVYLSDQAHQSIDKALRIAGMGDAQLRRIPLDSRFRMISGELAAAIEADRMAGLRPWLVVASAGTTDTGAIDPLDEVAEIASRAGCWLHVDAAYGGFFMLTERGRAAMKGIERSDSLILDPHKSLFLPWGSGVVLVRDVNALARANRYGGHYMQDSVRNTNELSPADLSPELSRPFRALRMWLPLMVHGVAPFRAALDEKLLLADYFHREIQQLGFEVGPEPDLTVVTFRWAPGGLSGEEADLVNEQLVEAIRRDGRVFLTSTRVGGRFMIRMAALNHRTHKREIDLALQVLSELTADWVRAERA